MLKTSSCAVLPRRSNSSLHSYNWKLVASVQLESLRWWFMPITSSLSNLDIKTMMLFFPTSSLIHKVVSALFLLVTTWLLFIQSQSNSILDTQCRRHQTLFILGFHEIKNCSCLLICLCKFSVLQAQSGSKSWFCSLLVRKRSFERSKERSGKDFFLLKACLPVRESLPGRLKHEASAHENVMLYEKEKTVIWCSGFVLFSVPFDWQETSTHFNYIWPFYNMTKLSNRCLLWVWTAWTYDREANNDLGEFHSSCFHTDLVTLYQTPVQVLYSFGK